MYFYTKKNHTDTHRCKVWVTIKFISSDRSSLCDDWYRQQPFFQFSLSPLMRQESTESDTIDRLYSIECHKRALLRAHRDHSENMSEHNPDSILRVKRYFHHHQEQTHDVITTLFSVFTRTIWHLAKCIFLVSGSPNSLFWEALQLSWIFFTSCGDWWTTGWELFYSDW